MACPGSRIPCYDSEWLYAGALHFAPPALEVLAEMKSTIFYNAFCLLILRLELSLNAICCNISFSMTWLCWLPQCTII